MRRKILNAPRLAGILLGIIACFNGCSRSTTPSPATDATPEKSPAASDTKPVDLAAQQSPAANPTVTKAATRDEEIHAEKIRRRIAELNELAMNSDTNSLNTILSELTNPDKEIRKGALEATIQFADRAAIPRLQEIADRTQDATEKAALLEAVEYLKLPSLTEYLRDKDKKR